MGVYLYNSVGIYLYSLVAQMIGWLSRGDGFQIATTLLLPQIHHDRKQQFESSVLSGARLCSSLYILRYMRGVCQRFVVKID